jgi:hypothetical protein
MLWLRREPNGNHREIGLTWWEWSRFQRARYRTPLSISFAFVATHNHFVLDRGGKVFNRSAPVIKLPPSSTEDDHLALLGLLNSSTACFWMKQVFHNKGASSGNTIRRENWEPFIEFDSTKMKLFPVAGSSPRVIPYAKRLDHLAQKRVKRSVESILEGLNAQAEAPRLKAALETRRSEDLQDDARVLAVCEVLTGRRDFSLSTLVGEILQEEAIPSHPFHLYKPGGLVKRVAWERTWADQRREDAGEAVTPQVPPAYGSTDFLRPDYYSLRGKLDVPKERFTAFTEAPGRTGDRTPFGWAGWTPLQRLRALLALDETLEDEGVSPADRMGLLDSAWRLLPDAAREDAAASARLKAELQPLVGLDGPGEATLEAWKRRFPPPRTRSNRAAGRRRTRPEAESEEP